MSESNIKNETLQYLFKTVINSDTFFKLSIEIIEKKYEEGTLLWDPLQKLKFTHIATRKLFNMIQKDSDTDSNIKLINQTIYLLRHAMDFEFMLKTGCIYNDQLRTYKREIRMSDIYFMYGVLLMMKDRLYAADTAFFNSKEHLYSAYISIIKNELFLDKFILKLESEGDKMSPSEIKKAAKIQMREKSNDALINRLYLIDTEYDECLKKIFHRLPGDKKSEGAKSLIKKFEKETILYANVKEFNQVTIHKLIQSLKKNIKPRHIYEFEGFKFEKISSKLTEFPIPLLKQLPEILKDPDSYEPLPPEFRKLIDEIIQLEKDVTPEEKEEDMYVFSSTFESYIYKYELKNDPALSGFKHWCHKNKLGLSFNSPFYENMDLTFEQDDTDFHSTSPDVIIAQQNEDIFYDLISTYRYNRVSLFKIDMMRHKNQDFSLYTNEYIYDKILNNEPFSDLSKIDSIIHSMTLDHNLFNILSETYDVGTYISMMKNCIMTSYSIFDKLAKIIEYEYPDIRLAIEEKAKENAKKYKKNYDPNKCTIIENFTGILIEQYKKDDPLIKELYEVYSEIASDYRNDDVKRYRMLPQINDIKNIRNLITHSGLIVDIIIPDRSILDEKYNKTYLQHISLDDLRYMTQIIMNCAREAIITTMMHLNKKPEKI